jgi:hypothetical protein
MTILSFFFLSFFLSLRVWWLGLVEIGHSSGFVGCVPKAFYSIVHWLLA